MDYHRGMLREPRSETTPHEVARDDQIPWEDLAEMIASGQVVLVVGDAALTVRMQGRWQTLSSVLAARLAEKYGLKTGPATTISDLATQILRKETGQVLRHRLRRIHDELLQGLKAEDIGDALRHLCAIRGFPLILTTSSTCLVDRALTAPDGDVPNIYLLGDGEQSDLPVGFQSSGRPSLVHLFGRMSAQLRFPLTEEDLLESLRRLYEDRPAGLLDQLAERNLLFVGLSYPDWLTRMFIRSLRRDRLSDDRKTLKAVADAAATSDAKLLGFLESLGAGMYVYKGDVDTFAANLHRTWLSTVRPEHSDQRPVLAQPPPDAVVFLSYSTADVSAAQRAAKCFEDRQLSCWFDRTRLASGSHYDTEIDKAIRRCVFFVALLSRNTESLTESYFREEWATALTRMKKQTGSEQLFILPLVVDDLDVKQLRRVPWEFEALTIQTAVRGEVPAPLLDRLVAELRSLRAGYR